ncbi:PAS domain S-box protein [Haloglomus litoreum]|uniref:PAS domain S-box protein n=1 Tax=Haloglomus litoreum TaxID=3034026 RepID=UPI0023E7A1DC|nr:PAS domain S-box protein [Haloglomus sp. DT116]
MGTIDAAALGARADGQLRVLVLVAHRRDRELFVEQLADGYEVLTATPDEEWPTFDLCLVGSDWYPEVATKLSGRRAAAEPVQLPVLLLLRGQPTNTPWLSDALGETIDDVVELPTGKLELDARVASLARDRNMSLALAEQRDQLRLFQRAIDEAAVGISISDYRQPDNPLVYINDRFEEITGYDAATALGRNCRFLQGADTDPEQVAELRRAIEAGEPARVQLLNYRQDGTPFWNRLTVAPIRDDEGTVTHFVGFQEDVTEERERERRYEAILDNADQFAGLLEPDGTVVEANAAALDAIDATRGDVVGHPFPETEWFDDDSRPVVEDAIERAAAGELVRGELDLTLSSGDLALAFTLKPVTDADGGVELLVAEGRDITPLKQRERELQEEQAVTEAILDAVPDVFYMFDTEGTYVRWNDRFNEVTGCTDELIRQLGPFSFIPEPDRPRVAEALGKVSDGDGTATVKTETVTLDGERIPYEFANARIEVDGETVGYAGIGRDVSERVARERELEQFEAILHAAPDPVYALDTEGRFTLVNDAMVEELGYDREAFVGSHVSMVMPEEGVARGRSLIERLLRSDETFETLETTLRTTDGVVRQFEINITLLTGEDGAFLGTVGVCRDVTELRQNERRLSVFDRVLRHNLRNKMNIMLARARNIEAGSDDPVSEAAAIRRAGEELLALSDRTRKFHPSISPEGEPTTIDVAAVARQVVAVHREEHPDAAIAVSAPDTALVRGHETLELALDELVGNAITHHDGDRPAVELQVRADEDRVTIEVADDGPGIGELERSALQRGHETPLEHATGLGLWFVRWTVTNVGGEIEIEDRDPRGSIVRLSLPRARPDRKTDDG